LWRFAGEQGAHYVRVMSRTWDLRTYEPARREAARLVEELRPRRRASMHNQV
jgi:hypothetical protein